MQSDNVEFEETCVPFPIESLYLTNVFGSSQGFTHDVEYITEFRV